MVIERSLRLARLNQHLQRVSLGFREGRWALVVLLAFVGAAPRGVITAPFRPARAKVAIEINTFVYCTVHIIPWIAVASF